MTPGPEQDESYLEVDVTGIKARIEDQKSSADSLRTEDGQGMLSDREGK